MFSLIITRSKSSCLQNRITWLRINVFHLSSFEHLAFNIPKPSLIFSFFWKMQFYIVIYYNNYIIIYMYLFLEYTVQLLYMKCTCWVVSSFQVMSTNGIHKQKQSRAGQNCNDKRKVNWRTIARAGLHRIGCCPVLHKGGRKIAESKRSHTSLGFLVWFYILQHWQIGPAADWKQNQVIIHYQMQTKLPGEI